MVEELTQEVTVLVIDDQESMREGCRQTLEEQGHRTLVAGSGEQGIRLVKEYEPTVVLVDLKMPGMSGIEVIDEIRKIDPHIVTIVITGYGSISSAVGAMKRGTFDYVTKPFGPEMLVDAVNRAIEQYGRQMRAEELEQAKEAAMSNFAAFVSHQLKSPAAAAAQYIEVVMSELTGPLTDKQRSALERAYRRTEDLTTLIRDWLKLGQLDAGMLEADFKPVELGRVIEEAWNAVSDEEGRSRITLSIEMCENVKPMDGDEDLLREAFTNLFSNSVKFTSGPGEVTVQLAPEGKHVAISVKDAGIGIPEEELPHLFEPFYRGARAGVKRIGGFGLGLSIVKKIISVHGGTIAVASTPGQGATFMLKLPTKAGTSAITTAPPEIVAARPKRVVGVTQ